MDQLHFSSALRMNHAYIVSAPSLAQRMDCARSIAMAAVCQREENVPCGSCRACRKVQGGIHPDVTVVSRLRDDKGNAKRNIVIEQVRAVGSDAYILPNEARRKVYIFEEAELMNENAQNAALKLLEEPPANVLFVLCAENVQLLLPTVRSRCVEYDFAGEEQPADEKLTALAEKYLAVLSSGDEAKLFRWCMENCEMDTQTATAFLQTVTALLTERLCAPRRSSLSARSAMDTIALCERCIGYLRVNVGVKHIFGLLAVNAGGGK